MRYLSDAFRVLVRTLPPDRLDDRLRDIIAWLGAMVRTTDSSLVDAWESAGELPEAGAPPQAEGARGGRPSRHGGHGAQRIVCPRAPGRARSHPRAGQP